VGVLAGWLLFWVVLGGLIGFAIGNGKGRGAAGFWLGMFLGWIGWIIVATMRPSVEVEAERLHAIQTMLSGPTTSPPPRPVTRSCPYCAEDIRAEAKVCRYCGRDVEPAPAAQLHAARTEADFELVRTLHPTTYERAARTLASLTQPPERPVDWLAELCTRLEAGAPLDKAAGNIPLDWTARAPLLASPTPASQAAATVAGAPVAPDVRVLAIARTCMADLPQQPANPDEWLAELSRRIGNGSPPEAAAARIPLDWGTTT
jgi:hypothetical protein